MAENINYYEILAKLREFEYKLLSVNVQETSSWDIDVLLLQAKAYIFENKLLKNEFKKRQNNFYKKIKNEKYISKYKSIYEKIKEFAQNKAKAKQRNLMYNDSKTIETFYGLYNAKVTNNKRTKVSCFIDVPENYYYPSLQADVIELVNFPSKKCCNNLIITTNLLSFYYGIDVNLASIRLSEIDFTPSKAKNKTIIEKQKEVEENSFSIPKDLEFYIASGDIKSSPFIDCFKLFFYASSMCYVLNELQKYIQNELYKNEYPSSDIPFDNIMNEIRYKNESLFCLIKYIREYPNVTIKRAAKDLGISDSCVSKYCQQITDKFNLKGTKGIATIRGFVKKIPEQFFIN